MSIHNRGLGQTEQRHYLDFQQWTALSSGDTGPLCHVPYPCVIQAAQLVAFSVESNINLLITASRFVVGQGLTTWALGTTFSPSDYGVSGPIAAGISLPASGSTLNNLMANDVLGYQVGGGNTAAIFGICGGFVVKPTQDAKVFLGLSSLAPVGL